MKYSILFLVLTKSFLGLGQGPVLWKGKPSDKNHGIHSKMIYEVIVNTNSTKTEVVKKAQEFLKEAKLVPNNKSDFSKVSDDITEVKLPLVIRQGYYFGKGMMGAQILKAPVYLSFNTTFRFNKEGQVQIIISDFVEIPFFLVQDGVFFIGDVSIKDQINNRWERENPKLVPIRDSIYLHMGNAMNDGAGINKLFYKIKGGREGYKNYLIGVNAKIDHQFKYLDSADLYRFGKWFNNGYPELISYYDATKSANKWVIPMAKERADAGYLLCVDNDRWDNYFEPILNGFFLSLAEIVQGSVLGIAKDGKQKYSVEGDELKLLK